jgi:hypothetical protein
MSRLRLRAAAHAADQHVPRNAVALAPLCHELKVDWVGQVSIGFFGHLRQSRPAKEIDDGLFCELHGDQRIPSEELRSRASALAHLVLLV